ncbi:hypothetical protein LuPra_05180 [Luteitalea pratensis]|uniref:Uncharacterized protein n=1 Tax=Luteitalea pratensis TaxID=1855912 RepID=A0A143PU51_LUTPR|nr:hypothetical protein LuPra_05180 [Luteitalea pratensis]
MAQGTSGWGSPTLPPAASAAGFVRRPTPTATPTDVGVELARRSPFDARLLRPARTWRAIGNDVAARHLVDVLRSADDGRGIEGGVGHAACKALATDGGAQREDGDHCTEHGNRPGETPRQSRAPVLGHLSRDAHAVHDATTMPGPERCFGLRPWTFDGHPSLAGSGVASGSDIPTLRNAASVRRPDLSAVALAKVEGRRPHHRKQGYTTGNKTGREPAGCRRRACSTLACSAFGVPRSTVVPRSGAWHKPAGPGP